MNRKRKLVKIAERIARYKAREVTTNYIYWIKRALGKSAIYPKTLYDRITFYFFLPTAYPYIVTPSISKSGIIYIPKALLHFEKKCIEVLVHEINHWKHPELSEKDIRNLTEAEIEQWKIYQKNQRKR